MVRGEEFDLMHPSLLSDLEDTHVSQGMDKQTGNLTSWSDNVFPQHCVPVAACQGIPNTNVGSDIGLESCPIRQNGLPSFRLGPASDAAWSFKCKFENHDYKSASVYSNVFS